MKGQTGKQFGDSGNDGFGIIFFIVRGKGKIQPIPGSQTGIRNVGKKLAENLGRDRFHLLKVNAVPVMCQRGIMMGKQIGPVPLCGIGTVNLVKNGVPVAALTVNIVGSQVFSGPFFAGNQYWGGNEAVLLDQIPCG